MRLPDFISDNLGPILAAWEGFAQTVHTPLAALDSLGLREHAEHILSTVAADMRRPQTAGEQKAKAEGLAPRGDDDTAAETHAVTRLISGFTMDQMVSEYRALRSSVLTLWMAHGDWSSGHQVDDMVRFNEAIDQALAESIGAYGRAVDTTRKLVLGVLGHDLRTPLGAITLGSDMLLKASTFGEKEKRLCSQVSTSARRANQIVSDLVELAKGNLGIGLSLHRQRVDLASVCAEVIQELATCHPSAHISYAGPSTLIGRVDPSKIAQVFSNLVSNAIHHGDPTQPVTVELTRNGSALCFTVHNGGEPVPATLIPFLFNPQGRASRYSQQGTHGRQGLGLGLFIAWQIVSTHGGTIEVDSSTALGTTFKVSLPD